MDSIGAELRVERERRGLSREDVAESTKITVQNLAAIEEDRFDVFPNRVYARAFLRDYANFLGLDSGSLLETYEQQRADVPESPPPVPEVPIAPKRRWRAVGHAFLVVGVLAGLAMVGLVGWRAVDDYVEMRKPAKPRHAAVTPERPATPPAPVPAGATATPTAPAPPTPSQPPASSKPFLKLTALGAVWVSVKVDGQTKLFTTIPVGTTQTFAGKKVVIRAGRANAVQIEQNGTKTLLGSENIPQTRVFTTPQPPAQAPVP